MVAAINFYLNEWLNQGIPDTCDKLCATVEPQHQEQCNIACFFYGVYGFIEILQRVGIDPIFLCQNDKQCPANDCPAGSCAYIQKLDVYPNPIKSGDVVTITGYYVVNGTAGAGTLTLNAETCTIESLEIVPLLVLHSFATFLPTFSDLKKQAYLHFVTHVLIHSKR